MSWAMISLASRRHLSLPVAALCLLVSVLLVPLAASVPAGAAPATPAGTAAPASIASEEGEFLTRLNTERKARGLRLLVSDTKLASTSRSWSSTMASRNSLVHDPNLVKIVAQVEPAWRAAAENIGKGSSVKQLHDLFLASSGHRANMLNNRYNRVGIGVVHSGSTIWVTVRFLEGPTISGSTGLATPSPPGVATVIVGDFNGDGNEDFLTYGPGAQADELWFGRDDRTMSRSAVTVNGHYRPIGGDFDGDGQTEILWYVPGRNADPLWNWTPGGWSGTNLAVNGTYAPFTGDFDGDDVDDIFWYGPGRGADSRWYGKAGGGFTSSAVRVDGSYLPFTGDLDGRYGDEILWYSPGTAPDYIWYSNSARDSVTSATYRINARYSPFTGDFDGNGTDDVFWYSPGSGADSVWYTSTTRGQLSSTSRTVTRSYLPGSGDFDQNGSDDILWFSPSTASGDPLWWGVTGQTSISGASVRAS